MALRFVTTVYVLALVVSHLAFPSKYVWWIAAFFAIAMNFTYPWAAVLTGRFFSLEVVISLGLVTMAILGVAVSPIWVIAAIIGHGVWDLLKHFGQGVPFLNWYTLGCTIIDGLYATALILYLFTRP